MRDQVGNLNDIAADCRLLGCDAVYFGRNVHTHCCAPKDGGRKFFWRFVRFVPDYTTYIPADGALMFAGLGVSNLGG